MAPSLDSFGSRQTLEVGDDALVIHRLDALEKSHRVSRLPFSLKILLENLLRHEERPRRHPRARRGAGELATEGGPRGSGRVLTRRG